MAAGKISEVAARDVSSQGGSNFMLGCERVAQLMSDSQMHVWALITDCRPRLSPGPVEAAALMAPEAHRLEQSKHNQ